MRLSEAFSDPTSTVEIVVMFIDMTDSTIMKARTTQSEWLTTFGAFYNIISTQVADHHGSVVKYLGDGAMCVFSIDTAADAINAAIRIQEILDDMDAGDIIKCKASIGIASGKATRFDDVEVKFDYIGKTVDVAARLCDGSAPRGIWIDASTVYNAQVGRIRSKQGVVDRREGHEYLAPPQQLHLKGLTKESTYYEVFWSDRTFGPKAAAVPRTFPPHPDPPPTPRPDRASGLIQAWDDNRHHGFIRDGDNFYYFDNRFVVDPSAIVVRKRVHFVTRPPLQAEKNPVAACVLIVGQQLTRRVGAIPSGKPFGFVPVADSMDNSMDLFMYLGDNPQGIAVGDEVNFVVGENDEGPTAENPSRRPLVDSPISAPSARKEPM